MTHREGPLLVLAGAGSGKTRVITRRVAHLIDQGAAARSILAITFTNKAAGEMAERISGLTGGARVWVSTFHAFCARTLRRYAKWVGLTPDYTILDQSDQLVALKEALRETGTDPKLYGAPKVLAAIAAEKDKLRTPQQTLEDASSTFEDAVARAYDYYQELLSNNNALDFTDLLVKTVELLRQDEVREVMNDRYRHLLIDEYQDTNHVQYELTRLLAQEHQNVCATGDPDQSIYGWRGADIGNILRFEEDYPNARVVKLEQNFRSTKLILDAANGLIRHNTERREKDLVTNGPEGEPVRFRILQDDHEEARFVARAAAERIAGDGVARSEVAVFYRAGALSRALETAFQERGLPYKVVGSLAFYQRREIKDVLSYLRLVHNPRDDVALQRIVNVPPRGVGKQTVNRVRERARDGNCSMFEAAGLLLEEKALKGRGREGLRVFLALIEGLQLKAGREPAVEEILRSILEETRYRDYVAREFAQDENDRMLNLESLLAGARDFDRRFPPPLTPPEAAPPPALVPDEDMPLFGGAPAPVEEDDSFDFGANVDGGGDGEDDVPDAPGADDTDTGISGFLSHTALMSSAEDEAQDDPDRVSLMTIHAAKGLEFDTVYVVGLEDGLFPHSRSLEEGGGLEEERRLAYVALTRAKRRLVLCRANWRTYQGRSKPQRPSIFLLEVPARVFPAGESPSERELSFATVAEEPDPYEGVDEIYDEGDGEWESRRPKRERKARPRPWNQQLVRGSALSAATESPRALAASASARKAPAAVELAPKDRVMHEHFGYGTVIELSGRDHRRRAKVRFDEYGLKDLVLQYARMVKLES